MPNPNAAERRAGAQILPFRKPADGPGASGARAIGAGPALSAAGTMNAPADPVAPPLAIGEADDYRHRMTTNLAGFAVALALVCGGIWLADSLAALRRNEDCLLLGLKSCREVARGISPAGP